MGFSRDSGGMGDNFTINHVIRMVQDKVNRSRRERELGLDRSNPNIDNIDTSVGIDI